MTRPDAASSPPLAEAGKLIGVYREVREKLALERDLHAVSETRRDRHGRRRYQFDLRAHAAVLDALQHRYAAGKVLSQEVEPTVEFGEGPQAHRFVVDAVDGSDNFHNGLPLSAMAIAALPAEGALSLDTVEIALVGSLDEDLAWFAVRGHGAWQGARRLRVRSGNDVARAFVSFEPQMGDPDARFTALLARARAIRSFGCASRALTLVASGSLDAHVDVSTHLAPQTYLAAAFILQEAGGLITTAAGEPVRSFGSLADATTLVATGSKALGREIIEALGQRA